MATGLRQPHRRQPRLSPTEKRQLRPGQSRPGRPQPPTAQRIMHLQPAAMEPVATAKTPPSQPSVSSHSTRATAAASWPPRPQTAPRLPRWCRRRWPQRPLAAPTLGPKRPPAAAPGCRRCPCPPKAVTMQAMLRSRHRSRPTLWAATPAPTLSPAWGRPTLVRRHCRCRRIAARALRPRRATPGHPAHSAPPPPSHTTRPRRRHRRHRSPLGRRRCVAVLPVALSWWPQRPPGGHPPRSALPSPPVMPQAQPPCPLRVGILPV